MNEAVLKRPLFLKLQRCLQSMLQRHRYLHLQFNIEYKGESI